MTDQGIQQILAFLSSTVLSAAEGTGGKQFYTTRILKITGGRARAGFVSRVCASRP
jgi:hypothetical protein